VAHVQRSVAMLLTQVYPIMIATGGGRRRRGKTALLTFADLCRRQKRSVEALFAPNRIADCSNVNRIVATLAVQPMQALPSTAKYIDRRFVMILISSLKDVKCR